MRRGAGRVVTGLVLASVVWCGGPAQADPAEEVAQLLLHVQDLRHREELAQQTALARAGELAARRGELARANALVADQQARVAAGEAAAARLAGEQYRRGPSVFAWLFLADEPGRLLDGARELGVRGRSTAEVVRELREGREQLGRLREEAAGAAGRAEEVARAAAQADELAKRQVDAAEAELTRLTAEQLVELEQRETALAEQSQQRLLATGALGQGGGAPSPQAAAAVEFALAQLGKPYVWGAVGPDGFDCSGLTSKAWAAAGVAIPRTSQEQWAQLPKVRLGELRPGDLVVYFAEATHVAMYLGHGLMVHAPHTGTVVKVAPVAALPILGAVRPSAGMP
ncbi:C40 family peptidase [Kitasatospora sp. NPDC002227]|uniref:C40 family peptidase n=1 Tax=Kitasatospora sp. NPDC002227 TaxID=3154773 RepID=UPI00331BA256